jgi:hypothetical protein
VTVPPTVTVKASSDTFVSTFPDESAVTSTSVSLYNKSPLLLPVLVPETAAPPSETVNVEPSAI